MHTFYTGKSVNAVSHVVKRSNHSVRVIIAGLDTFIVPGSQNKEFTQISAKHLSLDLDHDAERRKL